MKKLLAILIASMMLVSITACNNSSQPVESADSVSDEVITIGHFGPLTGANSLSGQEAEKGAQLKLKQINAAGGIDGKQLKMIVYDDQGTPEAAVKSASRLVDEDQVDIILGSQLSANLQAAGERIEQAGIPTVGTGLGPVWLQNGWEYFFRSQGNNTGGIVPSNDTFEQLGVTRMATIVYQDEGSRSSAQVVLDELRSRGNIEVTAEEIFQPNDTDWTGQFSSMIATEPDGIMMYVPGEYAGPMMKQLRSLGYKGYVFGNETMSLPDIRSVGGSDADGIVFFAPHCVPDLVEEANSEKERVFLEAFVEEYGMMPASDMAYRTYDAMTIIEEGLRNAGSLDGAVIRDTIKNISGLEVLAGTIDYTKYDNGEGMEGMQMFITHNGKNILLDNFLAENPVDTYQP